jgi:hypothetical protein
MTKQDILKIVGKTLDASGFLEMNKVLKSPTSPIQFRIMAAHIGPQGFTGPLKALTPEGVKVALNGKTSIIRYTDIRSIAKATAAKTAKKSFDDDEDYDNDDDFDEYADETDDVIEDENFNSKMEFAAPQKKKKSLKLHVPGSGSQFIPKKKK